MLVQGNVNDSPLSDIVSTIRAPGKLLRISQYGSHFLTPQVSTRGAQLSESFATHERQICIPAGPNV